MSCLKSSSWSHRISECEICRAKYAEWFPPKDPIKEVRIKVLTEYANARLDWWHLLVPFFGMFVPTQAVLFLFLFLYIPNCGSTPFGKQAIELAHSPWLQLGHGFLVTIAAAITGVVWIYRGVYREEDQKRGPLIAEDLAIQEEIEKAREAHQICGITPYAAVKPLMFSTSVSYFLIYFVVRLLNHRNHQLLREAQSPV